MRIDKFLANKAFGSRKEVCQLIRSGAVTVNDMAAANKDMQIDPATDIIRVNGTAVSGALTYYVKLNKPKGYITAAEDPASPTVMDLLPEEYQSMKVYPVGRLDKDTEGLLLLTNDGTWGHRIIHGKRHVDKLYAFQYDGSLTAEGLERIRAGMLLGDGTKCKPARITLDAPGEGTIILQEGKYHQVKRMISAAGGTVLRLKRLSIGQVTLAGIEKAGEYTALTPTEIEALRM